MSHSTVVRNSIVARWVTAVGMCLLSMTWGHDLAYRLMMPSDIDHHAEHQVQSSVAALHEYMPLLTQGAIGLALAGGLAWMVMSASRGVGLSRRAQRAARLMSVAPTVVLPLMFVATEIIERLPTHAGVPPLSLLVVGILIQVACGYVAGRLVAVVLDGAARVARSIARLFRRAASRPIRRVGSGVRPRHQLVPRKRGVPRVCMERGPPASAGS